MRIACESSAPGTGVSLEFSLIAGMSASGARNRVSARAQS